MEGEVSGENPNTNVLRLNGRLQVTTARDALMVTAANPYAIERLTSFLNLHEVASSGTAQDDLTIELSTESPEDEKMKADIIESLEKGANNDKVSEDKRQAFSALHDLLMQGE